MKRSLLIIGAVSAEIDLLQKELPGSASVLRTEFLLSGVGSLSAALNLQEYLLQADRVHPSEILFLGSAGIYDSHDSLAWPRVSNQGQSDIESTHPELGSGLQYCNFEQAVLEAHASIPEPMIVRVSSEHGPIGRVLLEKLQTHQGIVNAPNAISLVALEPKECRAEYADLSFENLEAFGLAVVCERYQIPFTSLFAITNRVGPQGSIEWKKNYVSMGRELQTAVLEILQSKPALRI